MTDSGLRAPDPIHVLDLFPEERAALLELLRSLSAEQWTLATVCEGWSVKDVAAHLIADDLGRLAWQRDGHSASRFSPQSAETFEAELPIFINRQNESWVEAARRLSPRIVIDLLKWTGAEAQAHFESLDPQAPGLGVSWAGERESVNWFDLAREYTERWHHQAQIREAVGAPMLYEPRLFAPLLATLVRGVPHTLRTLEAPEGATVAVTISGSSGGPWTVAREGERWSLYQGSSPSPEASITIDHETAWRLFTKGVTKGQALERAGISGDRRLAIKVLDTVSIIA